ncbi:MFS transporter [Rhizorhabdus dicambivorans]|uniref:MFS transporter n=1 Tax=Rhizorhabdus dicambivorans TaxID=1850238 RepID=A0A2A4FTM2_9SPHN|nr:MFS transporter [Rhizorhabdus dicambivorans]ATE66462.1 MFS transporter [Rhizorhabdus dicambivorans]PCE41046.1 MFS transporter [Rhizorhabdus dicambivorans]
MVSFVNRLLRVNPGEWPKLAQFGLLGFLLQMGLGIGFSAGDAAFLANAGADRLALIFMMTPAVMLLYTVVFSYLLVRFSMDRVIDATIALLVLGGLAIWFVLGMALPASWKLPVYFGLKLYLAMWYIALYSLFWNYTDAYFTIQDGKRMFPLLAAAMAFGMTCGGLLVSWLAGDVSLRGFFLIWAVIAAVTLPVALLVRRRWARIADSEVDEGAGNESVAGQVAQVAKSFRTSRYTLVLTLTLFVTLLMTNLAEFQYSSIFEQGRSEAELASLLGALYAGANIFNMVVCLFVFTRLVGRIGVRNVALIMPVAYFAAFGFLFVTGSFEGALATFFAYHGILTSIEYNNQNLLFNAVPSETKRPVRTIVEGLAEPLASFVAGGFLLYAADRTDIRDLSGLGVILGVLLLLVVIALRQLYPAAMARNMQAMSLDFGHQRAIEPASPTDPAPSTAELIARLRTARRDERDGLIAQLHAGRDLEALPDILSCAAGLSPSDRHAIERMIIAWGDIAIPRLVAAISDGAQSYRGRSVAARTLARLSYPLFTSRLDALVREELVRAEPRFALAEALEAVAEPTRATRTLARLQRQQIAQATDFAIELLALGGRLPDYDLLIVSLHSRNPKVRANAIEAIENGTDRPTFLMLKALIDPRPGDAHDPERLLDMLGERLASPNTVELIAAAQALRDLAPPDGLAARLRPALRPGLHRHAGAAIATQLDLPGAGGWTLIDLIDGIASRREFAAASIEVQTRLALALTLDRPAAPVIAIDVAGAPPMWLAEAVVQDLAVRQVDLALALYRARDDRAYAA